MTDEQHKTDTDRLVKALGRIDESLTFVVLELAIVLLIPVWR